MKKSKRFSILAFVVLSGGILFSSSISQSQSLVSNPVAKLTIPQVSFDLSDLDIRDANNKKITSAVDQDRMRSLFVTRLNTMLLRNLTPHKTILDQWFGSQWDVVSGFLRRKVVNPIYNAVGWHQTKNIFNHEALFFQVDSVVNGNSISYWRRHAERKSFLYLVSSIISSTVLLR